MKIMDEELRILNEKKYNIQSAMDIYEAMTNPSLKAKAIYLVLEKRLVNVNKQIEKLNQSTVK